jgi:hypothetical protein
MDGGKTGRFPVPRMLRYAASILLFAIGVRCAVSIPPLVFRSYSPGWDETLHGLATPVIGSMLIAIAWLLWPNAASGKLRRALNVYLIVAFVVAVLISSPYYLRLLSSAS